jgi:hypothetical protein
LVQPGKSMLGSDNELILLGLAHDIGGDTKVSIVSRRKWYKNESYRIRDRGMRPCISTRIEHTRLKSLYRLPSTSQGLWPDRADKACGPRCRQSGTRWWRHRGMGPRAAFPLCQDRAKVGSLALWAWQKLNGLFCEAVKFLIGPSTVIVFLVLFSLVSFSLFF